MKETPEAHVENSRDAMILFPSERLKSSLLGKFILIEISGVSLLLDKRSRGIIGRRVKEVIMQWFPSALIWCEVANPDSGTIIFN